MPAFLWGNATTRQRHGETLATTWPNLTIIDPHASEQLDLESHYTTYDLAIIPDNLAQTSLTLRAIQAGIIPLLYAPDQRPRPFLQKLLADYALTDHLCQTPDQITQLLHHYHHPSRRTQRQADLAAKHAHFTSPTFHADNARAFLTYGRNLLAGKT